MQAFNKSCNAPIDPFYKDMLSIIRQLSDISDKYSTSICSQSQHEFGSAIKILTGITHLESACHLSTEPYNPAVQDEYCRGQHTQELFQRVNGLSEKINEKSSDRDQQSNQDTQSNIDQYDHGNSSAHVEPLSPGRDQGQSRVGSPKHGLGDQRSIKRSGAGPYYCNFPGCPTPDKKYKFLSKLQDHERSHGPAKFQCKECKEMFKQERILKKHRLRVHKVATSSNCSESGGQDSPMLDDQAQAHQGQEFQMSDQTLEHVSVSNLYSLAVDEQETSHASPYWSFYDNSFDDNFLKSLFTTSSSENGSEAGEPTWGGFHGHDGSSVY